MKHFGSVFDNRNDKISVEGIVCYVKKGFGCSTEAFGPEGLDSVYIQVLG